MVSVVHAKLVAGLALCLVAFTVATLDFSVLYRGENGTAVI